MANVKELSALIGRLRECGENLLDISNSLSEMFSATDSAEPKKEITNVKSDNDSPKISLIDIRKILTEKTRNGHREQVKALITKYGANALSEISEVHYPQLIKEAEAIGNE